MDKHGHIYALSDEEHEAALKDLREVLDDAEREKASQIREDIARLDGFLRGRAEADAPKRGKGANKDLAG